jgi:hypothetical protein
LQYGRGMKNLTTVFKQNRAKAGRNRAAELDDRLSRLLREKMLQEKAYEIAMEKFLSAEHVRMKKRGAGYPKRDKLHAQ